MLVKFLSLNCEFHCFHSLNFTSFFQKESHNLTQEESFTESPSKETPYKAMRDGNFCSRLDV